MTHMRGKAMRARPYMFRQALPRIPEGTSCREYRDAF